MTPSHDEIGLAFDTLGVTPDLQGLRDVLVRAGIHPPGPSPCGSWAKGRSEPNK